LGITDSTITTEHAPKTIKLYANRLNIGFDETDRIEATQVLTLSEKDYADTALVPLRFVKFQNLNNITVSGTRNASSMHIYSEGSLVTFSSLVRYTIVKLFVQDNLGNTETSKIKRIHFIGYVSFK